MIINIRALAFKSAPSFERFRHRIHSSVSVLSRESGVIAEHTIPPQETSFHDRIEEKSTRVLVESLILYMESYR